MFLVERSTDLRLSSSVKCINIHSTNQNIWAQTELWFAETPGRFVGCLLTIAITYNYFYFTLSTASLKQSVLNFLLITSQVFSMLSYAGTERFIDNLMNLMSHDPSYLLTAVSDKQCGKLLFCVLWELNSFVNPQIVFFFLRFGVFPYQATFAITSVRHYKVLNPR